jgi:DNA transformation protein
MPCSPSFVDHALDLLSSLGPVQARRLFGGYGLYARGVMMALLDDDELFVKTDDETRERFVAAGCRMWEYPGLGETTNYFRPPDDAHEDAEAMAPWARLGLDAALRAKAKKAARAAAIAARKAARAASPARAARQPARKPAKPQPKRGGGTGRARTR